MNFENIPEWFKPTKKKVIWSIIIAIIMASSYLLIIENTSSPDIIESIIEWCLDDLLPKIFSISVMTVLLITFLISYIIWSLTQKKK